MPEQHSFRSVTGHYSSKQTARPSLLDIDFLRKERQMYIENAVTGAVFNKDTVLRCSRIGILEFKFSCLVYVLGISTRIFRCFGRKLQLVQYVADMSSSYGTFISCTLLCKSEARYINTYQNITVILYYDNLIRSFATRVSQLKIWHFWITGTERNVWRCTLSRYSAITQFAKLATGEQFCRRCTHRKL